ncbi:MAG: hypothetical protein GX316_08370 [Firmicutes bacterium]|nr:hypothetical protein [Bacillota bacterium]
MDRVDQAMVQEIKTQVLQELDKGGPYPSKSPGKEYQAYRELVDAVRQEVLYELNMRGNDSYYPVDQRLVSAVKEDVLHQLESQANGGMMPSSLGYGYRQPQKGLSAREIETLKQEIIRDLQTETEEQEGRTKH